MPAAVEAANLRKEYPKPLRFRDLGRFGERETTPALRGLDLVVEEGAVFGLLGPNGAGKTTLMKILCGMVLADDGRARVLGRDVAADARGVRECIGWVPSDERSFYWRLTARQNLFFFGRLQGLHGAHLVRRVEEVLAGVDLHEQADDRFDGFSTGMRQRLALARGLLHDPPVLLLDEPTRSLDPAASHRLREVLRSRVVEELGKTVLLATHDLHEALRLCDAVALVGDGRVLRQGPPGEVLGVEGEGHGFRVLVEARQEPPAAVGPARELGSSRWEVRVPAGADALDAAVRELHAAGGRLLEVEPERRPLEEIFTDLIEGEVGDG